MKLYHCFSSSRVLAVSALALSLFASALPAQVIVGYYDFNQSASPITDQAGSPADMAGSGTGILYNQAAIPGYSFGATATLTGGSDWFNTSAPKYSALVNDFSVMMWINAADLSGSSNNNHSTVIFSHDFDGGTGWGVGFNGLEQGVGEIGQPFFVNYGIAAYDHGSGNTSSVLPQNTWINLAITKSSTLGVSFYENGQFIGSVPGATESANAPSEDSWYIGNGADLGRYYNGSIDELRIYSGVLSQSQILSISGVPEPSLYALGFGLAALVLASLRRQFLGRAGPRRAEDKSVS